MAGDPAMKEEAERSIAKVAAAFPAIKPVALAYFGGYLDFIVLRQNRYNRSN